MGKLKKIAFLSRYFNSVNRGAETYVKELSKRLGKNYKVEVLAGEDADSLEKMLGGQFDIVIPTNGRLQALKASVGRFFGKYKLIISGQAGIGKDDLFNVLIARPDVYIGLTDLEANWAKKFSSSRNVMKIPNGVDSDRFNPNSEAIDFGLKHPVVLSVGALFWYKHHDLTIKALQSLKELSLVIVGSGPEKKKLQELGDALLGKDRFKILEFPFENMPKVYKGADLFTLPSWDRESFGIVYVEAMASNLPVVAPNDLARKEIIGDGGVLANLYDKQEFVNAIEEALNTKWGDRPRRQAEKFSWDFVAKEYEKLIETLE